MQKLIFVFLGGGLGSVLRYVCSLYFSKSTFVFPVATFIVNMIGSLLIGLILGYLLAVETKQDLWKVFLVTGLCGGFTTFSAFSNESIQLFKTNHTDIAFLYIISSIILGLAFTYLGYFVMNTKL